MQAQAGTQAAVEAAQQLGRRAADGAVALWQRAAEVWAGVVSSAAEGAQAAKQQAARLWGKLKEVGRGSGTQGGESGGH